MTRSGAGNLLLLPILDAMALGLFIGTWNLSTTPRSNRLGVFEDTQLFLTVAAPVALAVLVIEVVVHAIVRALALKSAARRVPQVPLVQPARRRQRIRRIVLLPLLDSIVLGLIVGALILDIYIEHNPMIFYDFDRGTVGHLAAMFAVFSVPVVLVVLVAELALHQAVGAVQRRRSRAV